jgi:hypothetical protein
MPINANGICPRTTAVILKNLSSEPLNIKFQSACKNAANRTAMIIRVSIIYFPKL